MIEVPSLNSDSSRASDEVQIVASTPRLTHQLLIRGSRAHAESAKLPTIHVATYAVGHTFNDMAAAVWFSYLLLYLQYAVGLSGAQAGGVMFAGQLADALATPLVGLASDAGRGCCFLGRRKSWNLVGVAVVAVNFSLMFLCTLFPGWPALPSAAKAAALGVFAALFNVGWAAVQVSHMSLVPELTRDEGERVYLNSARYALTVLSNVAVFLVMLVLLPGSSVAGPSDQAEYKQPRVFQMLALVVLCVGLLCSAVFLGCGKEPTPEELAAREAASSSAAAAEPAAGSVEDSDSTPLLQGGAAAAPERRSSGEEEAFYPVAAWRDWLRVPDFWRVMGVYTLVRLSVNISQVYLTFLVTETLAMSQQAVAITPLLLYLAQLLSTALSRRIAVRLGRKRSIFAGSALTMAACTSMLLVQPGASAPVVYGSVLLLGAGLALSMVVSVSLEADLVGNRLSSAAFVYGACSFADKLSSGVFVLAVQTMRDLSFPLGAPHHETFIRLVNAVVPAASALLAALLASTLQFPAAPARAKGREEGGKAATGSQ